MVGSDALKRPARLSFELTADLRAQQGPSVSARDRRAAVVPEEGAWSATMLKRSGSPGTAPPFVSDTWQWKVLDPRSVAPRGLCWS